MAVYTISTTLDATMMQAALQYLEHHRTRLGNIDADSIGRVKQLALHAQHRPLVELCLLAERQRLFAQTKAKRDTAAQKAIDLTMAGASQDEVNAEMVTAAKADSQLAALEAKMGKQP